MNDNASLRVKAIDNYKQSYLKNYEQGMAKILELPNMPVQETPEDRFRSIPMSDVKQDFQVDAMSQHKFIFLVPSL